VSLSGEKDRTVDLASPACSRQTLAMICSGMVVSNSACDPEIGLRLWIGIDALFAEWHTSVASSSGSKMLYSAMLSPAERGQGPLCDPPGASCLWRHVNCSAGGGRCILAVK
jgi:hypothetical protein